MKKIVLISVALCLAFSLTAQTFSEWFRQKKTQKKYLLEQIAALKVYLGYVEKGYATAKQGLTTIQGIKQGDFKLHTNYFSSLLTVNPVVRRYAKVADIIALQIGITRQTGRVFRKLVNSHQFTPNELAYLNHVFSNLLNECSKNLDELYNVITNGQLQMKDDERIHTIDNIYTDMQDKQVFSRSFCNSASSLAMQRSSDLNDVTVSKKLNELK